MKVTQYLGLIFFSVFFITSINSCTNETKNKKNQNIKTENDSQTIDRRFTSKKLKFTSGVRSILEDSKGNIWLGSHNEGVALLQNGEFLYFTVENGLSHNQVRNIYEDKNGTIWFECGSGLSTYDGNLMSVYTNNVYDSLNEWQLNNSDLWFKGDEIESYNALEKYPGAYQYDGKKLVYHTFPLNITSGSENLYSISTSFVRSKNGTLWFGTYGALIGYNDRNFKIIDDASLGLNDQTGHIHIRSIFEDSNGTLWIGNNGIGVLKLDGNDIINFTKQHKLKQIETKGNSLDRVFSISEDTSGQMWFGTVGSGVWRYDGTSITNFYKQDGLESEHIWTIYKNKNGKLWFGGANPSGVYVFNGTTFDRKF